MFLNFKDELSRFMEQLARLTNTSIGVEVFHHKLPEGSQDIFAVRLNGGMPGISGNMVTIPDAGGELVGKFTSHDKAVDFRQKIFDLFSSGWRLQTGAIKNAILRDIGKIFVIDDSSQVQSGEYYRLEMKLELYLCGEIHRILVDATGEFILDGNGDIQYET